MVAGANPPRAHAERGCVELTPDRGLCRTCTASHVIVPAWYVPRRAYTVEVIGAALLGAVNRVPRRQIAERPRAPVDTVNDWLRRARHAAAGLIRHAILSTPGAGRDRPDPRAAHGDALAQALDALGDSAACFAQAAAPAPGPGLTGIDYLRLIAAQHYRDRCRALHIADPSQAMAALHRTDLGAPSRDSALQRIARNGHKSHVRRPLNG